MSGNGLLYVPDPVTGEVNNEWVLLLDHGDGRGLVETPVTRAAFVNAKRGQNFMFGKSPNSTPKFAYAQLWRVGGGGAATILWTRNRFGKVYVGAALQLRTFIDEMEPVLLPGVPVNMDSAVFDGAHGGFVDFYATEVPWSLLKPVVGEVDTYVFDTEGLTEEQAKEGIFGVRFIEGDQATLATLADSFTAIAFGRLRVAMGVH